MRPKRSDRIRDDPTFCKEPNPIQSNFFFVLCKRKKIFTPPSPEGDPEGTSIGRGKIPSSLLGVPDSITPWSQGYTEAAAYRLKNSLLSKHFLNAYMRTLQNHCQVLLWNILNNASGMAPTAQTGTSIYINYINSIYNIYIPGVQVWNADLRKQMAHQCSVWYKDLTVMKCHQTRTSDKLKVFA